MRGRLSDVSRSLRGVQFIARAENVHSLDSLISKECGWDEFYTKAAASALQGSDVNVATGRTAEFVDVVAKASGFGQLYPDFHHVAFNTRFNAPASARARFVPEGNMISASSDSLDSYVHDSKKVSTIVLMSEDSLESEYAEEHIEAAMVQGVSSALDEQFLDASLATSDGPTPITVGAERITATGNSAESLPLLLRNFSWQKPALIMHNELAASTALSANLSGGAVFLGLSSLGGNIAGVRCVCTENATLDSTGGEIVLVDCARIAASIGDIRISRSSAATIQLDDAIDSNGDASELVPLWQTGTVAIKAELYVNWTAMPGSVRVLEGVDW